VNIAAEKQTGVDDPRYAEAFATVEHALEQFRNCSDEEKERLQRDLSQLREMAEKLTHGQVEIVVFGEISTGKSALVNALIGRQVAEVNVQGGWTREVWKVDWEGVGHVLEGLADSRLVIVDTPGINEVGGDRRQELAHEVATRADLILFVTDSDVTDTEHDALTELVSASKPVLVVLNKSDLYSREELFQLLSVLRDDRLLDIVPPENVVTAAADPREVEYVIQSASGSESREWRTPEPQVEEVKSRILEILEQDGMGLIALNAAMYAADKTDRVARLRIELREKSANQTIWGFAAAKSLAVAVNMIPIADVVGGSAVDVSMVVTLAHIYGLQMSWMHAQRLIASIIKAAGWVVATEYATHFVANIFKLATLGYGTVLTAVPQGAAAGYGSYIVGQAAKYYFEHGASWGSEAPKSVVRRILDQTDKESVLNHLKDEIRAKISRNRYSEQSDDGSQD